MDFKNKHILIIGGTSGIGLATAQQLQQQGATVHIASRSPSEASEALGLPHLHLDVAQFDAAFAAQLPDELHGLLYCPGSIRLKPFERLKPEDFRQELELHVLGAVQVLQAVMPRLRKAKGASVVVFSSVAAKIGMPFHASVATAKAALEGLTVSLAAEYAAADIRFNAIAPSLTATPLAGNLLSTPEKTEAAGKRHPLARVGHPHDMASAACFLLCDSSGWMTGQVMHIDGGLSTLKVN